MSRPASAPACLPRSLLCPRLGKLLRPAHTGPRLITSHGPPGHWHRATGHSVLSRNGDGWRACSGAGGTGAGGAAQRPRPDLQRRPCQGVAHGAPGAPCSVLALMMRSHAVCVLASSPRTRGEAARDRVCGRARRVAGCADADTPAFLHAFAHAYSCTLSGGAPGVFEHPNAGHVRISNSGTQHV